MSRCITLVLLGILVISSTPAVAQVPTSEEGGRLEERFEQPSLPTVVSGRTIVLPGTVAPEGAALLNIHVSAISVVGSSVYSEDEFRELTTSLVGQNVPLAAVYDLAQRLTAKYGDAGYVLSRAIVPPQELDPAGAVITIEIVEAYVDHVQWPTELSRYRDFFAEYAAAITSEKPANINTVMRYLLLAGDLPGLDVTSRFEASESNLRASTLIVEVTEKALDAFARVDNRGTEGRGPWQYQVGASLNNVLGLHESLSVRYGGAFETGELQHIGIGYEQVLSSEGLTAFANVSGSWGAPGTAPLRALAFNSHSLSFDAGMRYPIIRSRDQNLTVSALVFLSDSIGELLGAPSSEDRLRGFRLAAAYDLADPFNGVNQVSATFSKGIEGLGSTQNGNPLASRSAGQVDFAKLEGSISRIQQLGGGFSLLVAAEAQLALTPLLSSEECGYGGATIGRAFDPSELTGDSCFFVSGELRFDPNIPGNPLTTTQIYAFADYGRVFRIAPSLGTPSDEVGASAGLGLRLGTANFSADLSAVKPLTGRLESDWRYFLTLSASY